LDDFIKIIRDSKDRDDARTKLMALKWTRAAVEKIGVLIRSESRIVDGHYRFTERQVNSILDLRLYQLTGLERESIVNEYAALLETIKDLLDILAKESRVMSIIKKELRDIKGRYGSDRLTKIVPDEGEISIEDLIANEGTMITITHNGFIKRTAVSSYRAQRRGGRGKKGMQTREGVTEEDNDFVEHLFTANTHDYLMFFTQNGRCYIERVFEIPEMGRTSKGRSIANLLQLQPEEKIAATLRIQGRKTPEETFAETLFVVFANKSGIVKKSSLSEFKNIRKNGMIAIRVEEGNRLIDVKLTNGDDDMVLITRYGMSIRFNESDMMVRGRATIGVKGIELCTDDEVVAAAVVDKSSTLLVVSENAIGKRTPFDDYRVQTRGGKGIITMKLGEKNSAIAGALTVKDSDELMLITNKGQAIRTRISEIRELSRNTMGVRLMVLRPGEKIQAIAPVVGEEAEENLEGLDVESDSQE
jgi:DNA gyrase subunit A